MPTDISYQSAETLLKEIIEEDPFHLEAREELSFLYKW